MAEEQESKTFHLDTIISAIVNRTISPIAAQEYPQLCAFLFKNCSLPESSHDAFWLDPRILTGFVQFGLSDQYPDIFHMLKGMKPADDHDEIVRSIRDAVKKHFGNTEQITLQPFTQSLVDKLTDYSWEIAYNNFTVQSLASNQAKGLFSLPDWKTLEIVRSQKEQRPSQAEQAEPSLFGIAIERDILLIARATGVHITLDRTLSHEGKPQIILDVPDDKADFLLGTLNDTGILEFIYPIQPANSVPHRNYYAIDMSHLDNSFAARLKLSEVARELTGASMSTTRVM